jgi:hypothetical protein
VDFEAHAAGISHQRGSWLACRREISPKLERSSCQKRIGEKDTLCHAQLDFYHLSKIFMCDSENQHIEMIREIPEPIHPRADLGQLLENQQQLRCRSS